MPLTQPSIAISSARSSSDRARGLIGEEEAEAARVEIARRLLAADSKAAASGKASSDTGRARTATIAVAVALPLLALGLYLAYGSPRLPDQPLAARLQDPASNQNLEALVARVEARLREHPEEGEGWDAIAPVYMGWRRYSDAADAYGQAIRLLGNSAKRLSGQGQALVLANNGVVTEEARTALGRAVELDQTLLEPRILLAIAKEQDGQFQSAIEDWRALLDKAPQGCALARDGGEEDRHRRSASRGKARGRGRRHSVARVGWRRAKKVRALPMSPLLRI